MTNHEQAEAVERLARIEHEWTHPRSRFAIKRGPWTMKCGECLARARHVLAAMSA